MPSKESTMPMTYCEVSFLSRLEATLPKRYKFDFVVLTLCRCCDFNAVAVVNTTWIVL